MVLRVLFLTVGMLFPSVLLHFIPLPNMCALAALCNHTWIQQCGREKTDQTTRMFIDECDLFEFNCDTNKDFYLTTLEDCSETTTSTLSMDTMDTTLTNTTQIPTRTTTTKITTPFSTISPTYKTITATITYPTDTITSPKTIPTTTKTRITTNTPTTTITDTTYLLTTTPINQTTTVATTQTTVSSTSITSSTDSLNALNRSCSRGTIEISAQTTLSTTKVTNSTSSTITKSYVIPTDYTETDTHSLEKTVGSDVATTTTAGVVTSAGLPTRECGKYSKDCERPVTWETTVEGETRDFYRILKDRYGVQRRFNNMQWPSGVIIVRKGEDSFSFGRHNES